MLKSEGQPFWCAVKMAQGFRWVGGRGCGNALSLSMVGSGMRSKVAKDCGFKLAGRSVGRNKAPYIATAAGSVLGALDVMKVFRTFSLSGRGKWPGKNAASRVFFFF